ncbi:MAG: hypothetical protein WB588_08775 [Dehalococcoidia bacterium]|jgi:hypothetical protein
MKLLKIFAISLLIPVACLTAFAAFDVTPSNAAGSENWTLPYNQSWGKCICIVSENATSSNIVEGCASAWGSSHCIAPDR